jgi:hypothetical protein
MGSIVMNSSYSRQPGVAASVRAPKPARRLGVAAALALSLGWAVAAAAQTTGVPVETRPVPLPAEKQAIVKEHIKRNKVPTTNIDAPVTVGMTVPETVELFALPQDTVTELPTLTSYKFLITGNAIAVVDPDSRKVIQIIQN